MCALIVVMPVIGPADDSAGVPQAVRRRETVHWSQEGQRLSALGVDTAPQWFSSCTLQRRGLT